MLASSTVAWQLMQMRFGSVRPAAPIPYSSAIWRALAFSPSSLEAPWCDRCFVGSESASPASPWQFPDVQPSPPVIPLRFSDEYHSGRARGAPGSEGGAAGAEAAAAGTAGVAPRGVGVAPVAAGRDGVGAGAGGAAPPPATGAVAGWAAGA